MSLLIPFAILFLPLALVALWILRTPLKWAVLFFSIIFLVLFLVSKLKNREDSRKSLADSIKAMTDAARALLAKA